MKQRPAFTLVEMVIVIALIGVVFAMVANMGTYFSQRARFDNKKEEVMNDITSLIHTAVSTNSVNISGTFYKYGQLQVSMNTGGIISQTRSSGQLTSPIISTTVFTGVTIVSSDLSFTAQPYGLGCQTSTSAPWFSIRSLDNGSIQGCYRLDPSTCKLSEIRCGN